MASIEHPMEGWFWKRVPEPTDSDKDHYVRRMVANAFRGTKYERVWVELDSRTIMYYATRNDGRGAVRVIEIMVLMVDSWLLLLLWWW